MKKFMVLYQSPFSASEKMAESSPEKMQASMQEWMAWREKSGGEAKVEFGMPLEKGKHIEGSEVSDPTTTVSGYSIIQAESLDDAAELLKDHPHLKAPAGTSIEVLEFLPMPGM